MVWGVRPSQEGLDPHAASGLDLEVEESDSSSDEGQSEVLGHIDSHGEAHAYREFETPHSWTPEELARRNGGVSTHHTLPAPSLGPELTRLRAAYRMQLAMSRPMSNVDDLGPSNLTEVINDDSSSDSDSDIDEQHYDDLALHLNCCEDEIDDNHPIREYPEGYPRTLIPIWNLIHRLYNDTIPIRTVEQTNHRLDRMFAVILRLYDEGYDIRAVDNLFHRDGELGLIYELETIISDVPTFFNNMLNEFGEDSN